MRTIVTGGAGFIGSHLCDRLIDEGHDVLVIDDLSVGRRSNIEHLMSHPNFKFIQDDIVWAHLDNYFHGRDWIFHLAARADIVPSIVNPEIYHKVNVDGTFRVLEAARRAKVKRLVYAASSSCYGDDPMCPTSENSTIDPQYPYALTKYLGEQYVLSWAQLYGMNAISLRFFNVYGPRARTNGTYGAVFGVFLAQLANGLPLTVVGDGEQRRDFTFVSDVVNAIMKAAETDYPKLPPINIGSGGCYTINYLARLLGAELIEHIPNRPGEPRMTFANTFWAKHYLDWEPKIKFEAGVEIMRGEISRFKDAPLWTSTKITEATKEWFQYLGKKNN